MISTITMIKYILRETILSTTSFHFLFLLKKGLRKEYPSIIHADFENTGKIICDYNRPGEVVCPAARVGSRRPVLEEQSRLLYLAGVIFDVIREVYSPVTNK